MDDCGSANGIVIEFHNLFFMEEDPVSWVEREHAVRLPKQSMGYLAYSAVLHVLAVDSLDAVDLYAWSPQDRRLKFIHTLSYHDHRTLCDQMAFSDAQLTCWATACMHGTS